MSDDLPVVTTLTAKQQRFLEHYLIHLNATEAARLARYAHPNKRGPELLKNAQIAAAIDERMKEIAMSANEVLVRLTRIARGDLSQYISQDGLDLERLKAEGDGGLLHKYKQTKRTTRKEDRDEVIELEHLAVELYPADAALVHLGRYHRLFTDNVNQSGEVTHAVKEPVMEKLTRLADLLSRARQRQPAAAANQTYEETT